MQITSGLRYLPFGRTTPLFSNHRSGQWGTAVQHTSEVQTVQLPKEGAKAMCLDDKARVRVCVCVCKSEMCVHTLRVTHNSRTR